MVEESCKFGFQRKNIEVFPWPSQSPDLNPIEHVWEEMKTKMENRTCKNVEELEGAIFQCWQVIDSRITANLVSSMPRRCAAVIAARGGHTKY